MKRHRTRRFAAPISIVGCIAVYCLAAGLSADGGQGNASADVQTILKRIDDLYRSRSSTAEITMTIITPNWQRTLVLRGWTRGQDRMFVRILSPLKEQGVGTLKIGNQMWNYFPKTDKVMKLPPSMMMSSWMGSDFTNDDLVKEYKLADDFTSRLVRPEKAEPGVIYIESRPKEGLPIIWDKTIAAIRESDLIPLWQDFFDERGTLVRSLRFGEVKKFGTRNVPSVMEMIPRTKEGYKTVIRYDKLAFDVPLGDEIFSLRNLQSQR
jgi:outer membrane lipoprotein-sorting protein